MRRKILLLCFVVAISVHTMAHRSSAYSPFGGIAAPPQTAFRSTSAMAYSNSLYASNPLLDEYGTAVSPVVSHMPSVRKDTDVPIIDIPDDDDEWLPVGDAVIPLLLLALAYAVRIKRTKKMLFVTK